MKKSDLYREWARVLDMCEGTNVDPDVCWRYDCQIANATPAFSSAPERYEFAVAILEGKPVFVGNCTNYDISILSRNPPKKTFFLNGVELPCPDGNKGGYRISLLSGRHYFSDFHDAQKVANAFDKLLSENTK